MNDNMFTGQAKQVENFALLINFIKTYGAAYNPSKDTLKLSQLELLLLEARKALDNINTAQHMLTQSVKERALAFAKLKILSTRLVNALSNTDASILKLKQAKNYNRKLQGKRAMPIRRKASFVIAQPSLKQTANASNIISLINTTFSMHAIHRANTMHFPYISLHNFTPHNNSTSQKTISTTQLSYTKQIEHFAGLIALLKTEPTYMPNEVDLKIVNLEALKAHLIEKNDANSKALVALSNARALRDTKLYKDCDSIYAIAKKVKNYVKSVYGANSVEFSKIRGLVFRNK